MCLTETQLRSILLIPLLARNYSEKRASNNISVLVPCQSPLLYVAGVGMLMLGVRCTEGVEGTDKDA